MPLRFLIVLLALGVSAPALGLVPNTPTNVAPANGLWVESPPPDLTGSAYSDPEGNAQTGAQFQVRRSSGVYGDATSFDSGALLATTTWTLPALTQSVTYFWHVRYRDASGWSAWSTETSFSYDDIGPTTPPWITVGPTMTTGVFTVTWGPCTDADSGLFGYDVGLKEFPSPYQYPTLLASHSTSPPPYLSPQTITVGPGTYTVRVRAVDYADNHSSWLESTPSFSVVADAAVPILAAPTVSASPTRNPINLSWTADASAVSYLISRSTDSGLTWRQVMTVAAPATSTTDDPGVSATYVYRIAIAWADRVGAWSGTSASVLYDVDRPTTLSSLTVLPAISNGPAFTLSWTDQGDVGDSGVVKFNVRRAPQGSTTWTNLPDVLPPTTTTTNTPPSDGWWQYRVRAVDAVGNTGYWTTLTVAYDTTPPSTPGQPSAAPSPGPVSLTWAAATDATSGVASYALERSTDGISFTRIATGLTTPSASDAVGEGQYWYRVAAVDAAGWEGPMSPASLPIIVDATAPNVPTGISATPPLSADGQLTIAWTNNGDPVSGGVASGVSLFEIQRAPAGSGTWTLLGTTPAASPLVDSPPSDGDWDYQVCAGDAAGNHSAWSATATAQVDTTAPTPPGAPTPSATVYNGPVSLTWAAAYDATSGVYTYDVERSGDGGLTWTLVASGLLSTSLTEAPLDGHYVYRVLATDHAGHTSAPSLPSVEILVDLTSPSIPAGLAPSSPINATGQVDLTWTAASDPVVNSVASGVAHYELQRAPFGTTSWTALAPNPTAAAFTDSPGDGHWQYRARTVDAAGNASGWSATAAAFVDTVAPSAPGAPVPAASVTRNPVSLSWSAAADATTGVASYSLERSPDLSAWSEVASGIASTSSSDPAPEGAFYYRVIALDGAANRGPPSPASVRVVVDKTPPQTPVAPTAGPTPTSGPVTVSWVAVADVGLAGMASYRVERSPDGLAWTAAATVLSTATTYDDAPPTGTWVYRVVAIDAAGNEAASSASSQVQVDSAPTRLVFTTGPSQVNVGECVPLTIQTRNAFDVPASPAANVTVTLGGSASVSLFSDGACTVPASSVVIAVGTTQVSYSWSSSAPGTATLTGSAPPLTGASQDYTVLQVQGGACSAGGQCATGVCADNVCCNVACTGGCESCNQVGYAGTCRPWAALSDPEGACGSGACAGTCNGAGACSYPGAATSCGTCQACNGGGGCGNAQDGTSCADTSYCNGTEVCQGGACQPGTPVTCAPSGSDVLACDEASQSCQVQSQSPPVIVHDAHPDGAVGIPYAYNAAGKITVLGPRPMQFAACAGVPPEFHVEPRTGAVSFMPTAAGVVSLCVRADNAHGWDSYSFPVQVAATAPADPVARIVATNATGIAPLTVTLDGSTSTSADASPLHAWRWREGHFGPRRFTTAIDAHYLLPGGYLGELRVVDRAGRIGSAVQQILALTAQGHRPPSAQIVASALQGDNALEVDLSCNCTAGDNPIRGLLWRLSTGETLQGSNVHVSLGPGRHHALLEVIDAEGLSAFAKQELVVTSAGKLPPECEVTADPPALAAPSPVTYEAALSPSSSDIATLELRAGTTKTDQPSLTLQENTPGRVETSMKIVDADGLECADVGLVRLTDGQSRLPPAIHSHASPQAHCGIPYSYGMAPPVVSGTGAFGFSVQGAPAGLTVKPDTGEIFWLPSREQAGPHDFTLVAASAAGSASEDIHVDVACGPAAQLQVACGCTSAGEAPLVLAALALAWAAWRRRRVQCSAASVIALSVKPEGRTR